MADMELVIRVSEEQYNKLIKSPNFDFSKFEGLINAIKNGTVLPKGHGRLMDADTFINSLKSIERLHIDDELRINILDYINSNILVESEISR